MRIFFKIEASGYVHRISRGLGEDGLVSLIQQRYPDWDPSAEGEDTLLEFLYAHGIVLRDDKAGGWQGFIDLETLS